MPKSFYAVKNGRNPGVYTSWSECESQTVGFHGAVFKKFETEDEAKNFISGSTASSSDKSAKQSAKEPSSSTASLKLKRAGPKDEDPSDKKKAKKDDQVKMASADESNSDSVPIYTNGCFYNIGKDPHAGLGVYWGPDHSDNLSERVPDRQTKNRAEIYAAVRAIQQAKEKQCKHVTIHTDSGFLINCHTKWMANWKKNDWKNSTGKPVVNREELEELDKAQEGIQVSYVLVDKESEGNENAKRLAKEGAKKKL